MKVVSHNPQAKKKQHSKQTEVQQLGTLMAFLKQEIVLAISKNKRHRGAQLWNHSAKKLLVYLSCSSNFNIY